MKAGFSGIAATKVSVLLHAEATERHAQGALGKLEVGVLLYTLDKSAEFLIPVLDFDVPNLAVLDGIEAYDVSVTLTNLLDTTNKAQTKSLSFSRKLQIPRTRPRRCSLQIHHEGHARRTPRRAYQRAAQHAHGARDADRAVLPHALAYAAR